VKCSRGYSSLTLHLPINLVLWNLMNQWIDEIAGERKDSSFKMGLGLEIGMRSKHSSKRRDYSFFFYTLMLLTNLSQCILKKNLEKCEPDDTLIRFTNLQTGWGPPTTHPVCNFFTLWQPDGVASGSQLTNRMAPPIQSIRLTIYEPDVRLSDSQILKNENWMASSGCPTRNFKVV